MAWWRQIFKRKTGSETQGLNYRVVFKLHSKDGKREVEVREFNSDATYLLEREWIDGTLNDRHSGRMVGPFASPEDAEKFIIATAWFRGRDE